MKLQVWNLQLRVCRQSSDDKPRPVYKTEYDEYPWLTSIFFVAHVYNVSVLQRMRNTHEFSRRRVSPDSGRQWSLFRQYAPPPTPQEVIERWDLYQRDLYRLRYKAPRGQRDTPLRALYRLYENLILDYQTGLRNEIEYFFYRKTWQVSKIPDPKDVDPARYAILAGITDLLVLAFNNNILLGLPRYAKAVMTLDDRESMRLHKKHFEKAPAWANRVPALRHTLYLPDQRGNIIHDTSSERLCLSLEEKNIFVLKPDIYFI